jgi:hypothetical protein
MNVQKTTLSFYVACFFMFGIPALVLPEWFSEVLGYKLTLKGALMEFIAAYGGLILGIGIYLLYCLKTNIKSGLVAVLIIMGSLFLGRIIGYGIEREINNIQWAFLVIELITIALLSSILYAHSSHEKYDKAHSF